MVDEDRRLVKVNETVAEDASEKIGVVVAEEPDTDPVTVVYDFRGATMLERHGIDEVYGFAEAQWAEDLRDACQVPEHIIMGAKTECPDCNGRGEIELFTSWAECDECGGMGRV